MSTLGCKLAAAAVVLGLTACGGGSTSTSSPNPPVDPNPSGSTSTQRGTLVSQSLTASLSTSQFTTSLNAIDNGSLVLEWGGPLSCEIDIYRIKYWTFAPTSTGGAPSPTLVSAALMIPNGPAAQCSGARLLLLYAQVRPWVAGPRPHLHHDRCERSHGRRSTCGDLCGPGVRRGGAQLSRLRRLDSRLLPVPER